MPTAFGIILQGIGEFWKELRQFAYEYRTIFEIAFILIYAIEQIGLILLIEMHPELRTIIISLFAVIVLTTFSLHKQMMESRIKILESELGELQNEHRITISEAEAISNRYNELARGILEFQRQSLNNRKHKDTLRGDTNG
jgi:hypothetical protein